HRSKDRPRKHQIRLENFEQPRVYIIYLATKELVKEFVEVQKTVLIGTQTLNIRPLVNSNKRIILSNVPPIIPHSYILDELHKLNIEIISPLSFLRVGLNEPGFAHIMSFRRQVYIKANDALNYLKFFNNYNIYPTTDSPACFICHVEGHLAKECPANNPKTSDNPSQPNQSETQQPPSNREPSRPNAPKAGDKPPMPLLDSGFKRPYALSGTSTESTSSITYKRELTMRDKTANKKKKEDKTEKINEPLQIPVSVQNEMSNNPTKHPCNFNQLQNLYDRTKGEKQVKNIIEEFKIDPTQTIMMLSSLYPLLSSRGMKSRFTKLRNRIRDEYKIEYEISLGSDSNKSRYNDSTDIEMSGDDTVLH
ncbi:Similar to Transposon TX1 uncharacterized 82 kDa protein (Xenopus laevis), partial [Cotesia congregata]